jgi:hypothetical protein
MRISTFKNCSKAREITNSDVYKVLDSIKEGTYKSVIAKTRLINDNKKRSDFKWFNLGGATFNGVFNYRQAKDLKKSSGLATLDFDHVKDLGFLIESINNDKYTFSSFISPSGDGLKVLVKIPPVDNDIQYKEYYSELSKHYSKYGEVDPANSDISRLCFFSYDEDLYLNSDSVLFTDKFIKPIKPISEPTNIPITDQNEIAERLEKWNNKRYTGSNRNTTLHAYAMQMNAFGVSQYTCEQYLFRYSEPDFGESEISQLIKSAYKNIELNNTQSFEDTKKVQKIRNFVVSGKNTDDIQKEIDGVDSKLLDKEIDKHKSGQRDDVFWYFTENESIKLDAYKYKGYLQHHNISKYYPDENSGYLFIKKDGNFIKEFNDNRIKDFVLEDLEGRGEIEAYKLCANGGNTFNQNFMNMIQTTKPEIQKDTRNKSYIYYKNTAVKVTKNDFELIPYDDLKGLVWEDQVIDRDLVLTPKSDGEFKTFIWKISGEDKERYYTFKSVIGYLLHSYQNEGKPKVIIFNDEMISDVPNGGSGKGLVHKAISHIKKLSTINGKGFDPSTQFAYQTVNTDTQVLLFDDIDKNFKFENLFSLITEGLTIEKKGKDAIKIPFNESPKISITTNYTVKGEGSSHKRRVFEVEMASYFNDKNTPEDEFGHLLFSEWSSEEWAKFDNYMLRCIQYFLKNGLVQSETKNLSLRKLRNDTNADFIDFMDNQVWEKDKRFYKSELKDLFISEYDDFKWHKWFNTSLFNKWVKKYVDYRDDLVLDNGKSNGQRFIIIEKVPF